MATTVMYVKRNLRLKKNMSTNNVVLRYYECDWSIPCIENELLFIGTKEECFKYLMKNWSVDVKEFENNLEYKYLFIDYLCHIQVGTIKCPALFDKEIITKLYEENKSWDDKCDWRNIDHKKFIFNQELIEILN